MKLKKLYEKIVEFGIENDLRQTKEIKDLLADRKNQFSKLSPQEKEFFDQETLVNPFEDTRILFGDPEKNVKSVIVGIDVESGELAVVDRLREKGQKIDLVISHHPEGLAYAKFYEVMDLQADAFFKAGIPISFAQNCVAERKGQVSRRVHAVNHQRPIDIARLLNIELLCAHTPCDNCAYQFMNQLVQKDKPQTMGQLIDLLYQIPEYKHSAKNNNPPIIALGSKTSRVNKVWVEFTGGTEGPQEIYQKLSSVGIDTIIAMHQSEEHYKKCKEANINVIFASHIASDNLGVNLMLDHLCETEQLNVIEFSGFARFARKNKK